MSRSTLSILLFACVSISLAAGNAFGAETLKRIFNDAATRVTATTDPVQKREILTTEFQKVTTALTVAENMPLTSATDRAAIDRYKAVVQDKQDELLGTNGYTRVTDQNLNAFSHFVVQDMEQADQMITISLVTLLLIIILIFLIAR